MLNSFKAIIIAVTIIEELLLVSKGYSPDKKTLFIMEGVIQYLTGIGIKTTFDFLANAPVKSRLVFTYIIKDFLEDQKMYGCEKLHNSYVIKDKSWIFGLNPDKWPEVLRQYGWRVVEDVDYERLNDKCVKPSGRTLISSSVERLMYAEKL